VAVNPLKGEVAIPEIGKGYFIAFTLADIAALEAEYGRDFFNDMEQACVDRAFPELTNILAIGLRKRNSKGEVEKVGDDEEFFHDLTQREDFDLACVYQPIMDAISKSWLGKTHAQLVEEAVEARKKQDAENLKRAKEAAEENGVPFDEALSSGLFKLLTHMASTQPPSGN
jgi:hypothetical protein